MDGTERRDKIIEILSGSPAAVSGTELAKQLGVSRQIIVQDVALLRAVDKNIIATPKGYLYFSPHKEKVNRCFMVKHSMEDTEDELCTIVDNGGKVLDVIVSHKIYGEISVVLELSTRRDIQHFIRSVAEENAVPLMDLTGGTHFHTVEADSEETLDIIESALKSKNYLLQSS